MSYSFEEPRQDPADDPRCPECGNDPCLCEQSHDCKAAHCAACGLCRCEIRWRRLAEGNGMTGWEFVSKCCESDVVHSDGKEFTIEEAQACG